jgi:hypothetical protein
MTQDKLKQAGLSHKCEHVRWLVGCGYVGLYKRCGGDRALYVRGLEMADR